MKAAISLRLSRRRDPREALQSCGSGMRAKKRPGFPGRFHVQPMPAESLTALRGDRSVDHLRSVRAGVDRNAAGLLGLGNLADEIDVEQAVLQRGVLHL